VEWLTKLFINLLHVLHASNMKVHASNSEDDSSTLAKISEEDSISSALASAAMTNHSNPGVAHGDDIFVGIPHDTPPADHFSLQTRSSYVIGTHQGLVPATANACSVISSFLALHYCVISSIQRYDMFNDESICAAINSGVVPVIECLRPAGGSAFISIHDSSHHCLVAVQQQEELGLSTYPVDELLTGPQMISMVTEDTQNDDPTQEMIDITEIALDILFDKFDELLEDGAGLSNRDLSRRHVALTVYGHGHQFVILREGLYPPYKYHVIDSLPQTCIIDGYDGDNGNDQSPEAQVQVGGTRTVCIGLESLCEHVFLWWHARYDDERYLSQPPPNLESGTLLDLEGDTRLICVQAFTGPLHHPVSQSRVNRDLGRPVIGTPHVFTIPLPPRAPKGRASYLSPPQWPRQDTSEHLDRGRYPARPEEAVSVVACQ
jgi:hypothetical protein